MFIEVKDFHNSEQYNETDHFNFLIKSLKYKYQDTWLYRWGENKIDKAIKYLCLLKLDTPLLCRMHQE